ncbi:hypothetical protein BIV57_12650 [Mangrovactinospora gilvigrisea]|uniref:Uncharacterized protein n=1 Tax=Mangrovactinospora gilvigrisea TaxID=1428644 RepID=A0A1J7BEQ9_9ACTN|nr:hypothetical protein [Mangrovactinospora gilvigrisea]OIV37171.1 hypothetical protein BIV57_12650 [Mangrovactinospora gilvigrisea]
MVRSGRDGGDAGFTGLDPELMHQMVNSLQGDTDRLKRELGWFRTQLAAAGVDSAAPGKLSAVIAWAEGQLPDLKHRLNLVHELERQHLYLGLDPTHPKMVAFDEPALSEAQAQREGRRLAADLKNHLGDGAEMHRIAQQLNQAPPDPDVAAAFYAALPAGTLTRLPSSLADTASNTAPADLRAFSKTLGIALSAESPTSSLAAIRKELATPGRDSDEAWNRAAMLSAGAYFPPQLLSSAARANGLNQLAANLSKNPDARLAGPTSSEAHLLGLPNDLVALDLKGLSQNPAAARDAIINMGAGHGHGRLAANLVDLAHYCRNSTAMAPYFGEAIDSAGLSLNLASAVVKDEDPSAWERIFGPEGQFRKDLESPHSRLDALGADIAIHMYIQRAEGGEAMAKNARELVDEFKAMRGPQIRTALGDVFAAYDKLARGGPEAQELDRQLDLMARDWNLDLGAGETIVAEDESAARGLGLARAASGAMGIASLILDGYTLIRPEDKGALGWVDRGAAVTNAVGTAAALTELAELNLGADWLPGVGEVVAIGSGFYLGVDYLWHNLLGEGGDKSGESTDDKK